MGKYYSVATLDAPEFLNIVPYNPLISKCEIKVLYTGSNDNHTVIQKDVAARMANSLPGSPIVGYYRNEKEDFGDHGRKIVIEDGEIKTSCKTIPYGFVAPNSRVWFKKFEEEDRQGNIVIRDYLMCEGYLWTGQYEEAQRIIDRGNNQSMEIDEETVQGTWTKDNNKKLDFFIINDAIFSKLCILGEDVEPCFEGASITAPDISLKYNLLDKDFSKTLYSMLNELKFALAEDKGGSQVENITNVTEPTLEENTDSLAFEQNENENITLETETEQSVETAEVVVETEIQNDSVDFAKEEDKETVKDSKEDDKENSEKEEDKEDKEEEKKNQYSLEEITSLYEELKASYKELQTEFAKLNEEKTALVNFKLAAEKKEKEEMISRFYMLSEEDKADVVAKIDEYSLDEIEAKLSVICVRNKVNFDLEDDSKNDSNVETNPLTYSLENENSTSSIPAWLQAVKDRRNN